MLCLMSTFPGWNENVDKYILASDRQANLIFLIYVFSHLGKRALFLAVILIRDSPTIFAFSWGKHERNMEMVRPEKTLLGCVRKREVCYGEMKEQSVVCTVQRSQYYAKNAKAGEPVSGNFHFLYASQLKGSLFCKETSKWHRGMKSKPQQRFLLNWWAACFAAFVFRVK